MEQIAYDEGKKAFLADGELTSRPSCATWHNKPVPGYKMVSYAEALRLPVDTEIKHQKQYRQSCNWINSK